jgi:hypothetical protein
MEHTDLAVNDKRPHYGTTSGATAFVSEYSPGLLHQQRSACTKHGKALMDATTLSPARFHIQFIVWEPYA